MIIVLHQVNKKTKLKLCSALYITLRKVKLGAVHDTV